ncbi:MAG TPA: hypothetical protein VFV92_04930 [Candidatus Bathyarchaeia archaeon]|nr:hypothetical protein [Candidatus Bathyarchaeia archaeon]
MVGKPYPLRTIEELSIENEALWSLLHEAWPHYYEQKKYEFWVLRGQLDGPDVFS